MREERTNCISSPCSAFWAAGWERKLDKMLAEYRAGGEVGNFETGSVAYRCGLAMGQHLKEQRKQNRENTCD